MTLARSDDAVGSIMSDPGAQGLANYARYFIILETVGGRSKNDCFELTLPAQEWCSILRLKQKKLTSFLERLENQALIFADQSENQIKIKCPKLAEIRDEYSRKSGHSPDRCQDKRRTVDTDTDTKTKADREPPVVPQAATPKKAPKKKCQLPSDWTPNQGHEGRASELGLDVREQAQKFSDHAEATGRLMLDWNAAFRMWLSNANKFAPRPHGNSAQTREERTIQNMREFSAALEGHGS